LDFACYSLFLLRPKQTEHFFFKMHSHTPEETTAISDDLVLESLGYTPGTNKYRSQFMQKSTADFPQSSSVRSLCLA
jgi:hypothetical protein